MKQKCIICGVNADSAYCFRHKPRKAIPKKINRWGITFNNITPNMIQTSSLEKLKMWNFFLEIWKKRIHKCENCGRWLGNEPLSYMFDHLLEKSKYPDLKYEEEDIMLTCLECHDNKTNGKLSDIVKNKIQIVRDRFGK